MKRKIKLVVSVLFCMGLIGCGNSEVSEQSSIIYYNDSSTINNDMQPDKENSETNNNVFSENEGKICYKVSGGGYLTSDAEGFYYGAKVVRLETVVDLESDNVKYYGIVTPDDNLRYIIEGSEYAEIKYSENGIQVLGNLNGYDYLYNFSNSGDLISILKFTGGADGAYVKTFGYGHVISQKLESGFDYSKIVYSLVDMNGNVKYSMDGYKNSNCFWLGDRSYLGDANYYVWQGHNLETYGYYTGIFDTSFSFEDKVYDASINDMFHFEEYEGRYPFKCSYIIDESDKRILFFQNGRKDLCVYNKTTQEITSFDNISGRVKDNVQNNFGITFIEARGDDEYMYWMLLDEEGNVIRNLEKFPQETKYAVILNEKEILFGCDDNKSVIVNIEDGTTEDVNYVLSSPYYNGWAQCASWGGNTFNFINENGEYMFNTIVDENGHIQPIIYADDSVIINPEECSPIEIK